MLNRTFNFLLIFAQAHYSYYLLLSLGPSRNLSFISFRMRLQLPVMLLQEVQWQTE